LTALLAKQRRIYLTKNKGTTAILFTYWQIHGSKTTGQGTKATPGQTFATEWGLGQTVPLKKDFSGLLQVGLIGYDQWQVSDNGGLTSPNVHWHIIRFTQLAFRQTMLCLSRARSSFSSLKMSTAPSLVRKVAWSSLADPTHSKSPSRRRRNNKVRRARRRRLESVLWKGPFSRCLD
jgi:hypothetical protein